MQPFAVIIICCSMDIVLAGVISRRRLTRNVYDPSLPAYPSPNSPFYQPPPYPVPSTTVSPASALMPQPPKYHDYTADNPYLDALNEPINPNFGVGLSAMQPTIMGGSFNFPTGNLLRPQESVGGTFGIARPVHVRFGTQGGPLYPWQDDKYAKSVNSINDSMMRRDAFRRDSAAYERRVADQQAFVPQQAPQQFPPSSFVPLRDPPAFPSSLRLFDLPPLPSSSQG